MFLSVVGIRASVIVRFSEATFSSYLVKIHPYGETFHIVNMEFIWSAKQGFKAEPWGF